MTAGSGASKRSDFLDALMNQLHRFSSGFSFFRFVSVGLGLVLVGLSTYSLGKVLVGLFWVDGRPTLEPVRQTLAHEGLLEVLYNTLVVVIVSAILALMIGSIFAWLNERTDARMGVLTDTLPLVPFLIPPVAGAIGWVLLLSPRPGYLNGLLRWLLGLAGVSLDNGPFSIYSWYGLILVFTLYQVPFVFLMVTAGLRSLDPALEEQSRVSGASAIRTIRRVTLPALGPSIGAAILLMAWQGLAFYSVPVIIGSPADIDVLSVRIVRLLRFDWPPEIGVAVGMSTIILLLVGLTWLAQRRLLRSGRFAKATGKASHTNEIELGRWKWPARFMMAGYLAAAAVLPLGALLIVSLQGYWSTSVDWGNLSFASFQVSVFGDSSIMLALRNSVGISGVTATIAMLIAGMISLYLLEANRWIGQSIDAGSKLPAVVPNMVLAVGIILGFSGPPFRLGGTLAILALAYLILYYPIGSVAADSAAAQIGSELPEASRVSGAGAGRTFWRISLPLMMASLVAGWALVFSRMAGDLTASVLLSGRRNPVVGAKILQIYTNGAYTQLAALTAVLVLLTFFVVVSTQLLQRKYGRRGTARAKAVEMSGSSMTVVTDGSERST